MRAMALADNISNESKFLDNAKQFMNAFYVEARDGGVTYKTPNDGWWYEEYASRDGLHPRILNGMMATLRDLHAYYIDTGDEEAKLLFNKGILALRSILEIRIIGDIHIMMPSESWQAKSITNTGNIAVKL